MLVPGVAFDLQGRRLGRGKGYYDQLLRTLRGTTCGVAFGDQIGYWRPGREETGDIIESFASNRLHLLHKGFRYVERSLLDLSSGSFTVVQVESELRPTNFDAWPTRFPQGRRPTEASQAREKGHQEALQPNVGGSSK